jgi:hypothetical protein
LFPKKVSKVLPWERAWFKKPAKAFLYFFSFLGSSAEVSTFMTLSKNSSNFFFKPSEIFDAIRPVTSIFLEIAFSSTYL